MASAIDELPSSLEMVKDDVIRWRRHLHRNPELFFEEEETSRFVYDTLQQFAGLEVSRPTKTSVLARLTGGFPGPVLALRADMDALPIQEETVFEFASRVPGKMHACGHDGHTAILLGTARVLAQVREGIHGEVRFIFQHAGELHPGGARDLVEAGVMEWVDGVVGLHLWSPLPVGQIGLKAGAVLAAPDEFFITIRGRGGHAAQPEVLVDPIVTAAQVVINLQHVVSRQTDPLEPVVLSVTQFHAGTAHNVIPPKVEINGTVRTFNPALRAEVPRLMERVIRGVTAAHGADYELRYEEGYNPVINDGPITARVREVLIQAFGANAVREARPHMGGEDFSAYQAVCPGTFFYVGCSDPEKGHCPHHHPLFTINEESLAVGVKAFIHIALRLPGEDAL